MVTILLYSLVVLIWGSTWLAVRFQVGVVPPEASVAYRIGIAAICMFAWAVFRRQPLRFTWQQHLFMALQGALIFSTNFFLFYHATAFLTTGLIAVIFSTASAMTLLLNALIFHRRPAINVVSGACLGFCGICVVFAPELSNFSLASDAGRGMILSLGGTLCFSMGSIVSGHNRKAGIAVTGNTAWAMFYGTVLLTLFLFASGKQFVFDARLPYTVSLMYLSTIGSVIAFAAYFALLGRIDAEKAAYATVLFPIIALSLSTLFEDYHWSLTAVAGLLIILVGNVLVLKQPKRSADPT